MSEIRHDDNEIISQIVDTKILASHLKTMALDNKNLGSIKGISDLIRNFEEILEEIEEQSKKIVDSVKSSSIIMHNLKNLYLILDEIKKYFEYLSKKTLFVYKSKIKRKIQNYYQILRSRSTQLMTSVALEQLAMNPNNMNKKTNMSCSELYFSGLSYYHGIDNKPKNFTLAYEKFIQAAELGDHNAMIMVSRCLLAGQGVNITNENEKIAFEWLEKASNTGKSPQAKNDLALIIIDKLKAKNPNLIKDYYNTNEADNEPLYSESNSVKNRDEEGSNVDSFRMNQIDSNEDMDESKSTDQKGQFLNIREDDNSEGMIYDLQFSIKLLLESANEGYAEAKSNLGSIYEECGDLEQATKWF